MVSAAMIRTSWQENRLEGGLAIFQRAELLRRAYRDTPFFYRSRQWRRGTTKRQRSR